MNEICIKIALAVFQNEFKDMEIQPYTTELGGREKGKKC